MPTSAHDARVHLQQFVGSFDATKPVSPLSQRVEDAIGELLKQRLLNDSLVLDEAQAIAIRFDILKQQQNTTPHDLLELAQRFPVLLPIINTYVRK